MIIKIDRTIPFDPVTFVGNGWSAIADQDESSLKLVEIDLTKIVLKTMQKDGENSMIGEEMLKRFISSGCILLDAKFCQSFYEEWQARNDGALEWLRKVRGVTHMSFLGTRLRGPDGERCILFLYWDKYHHRWVHDFALLSYELRANYPSVVLESQC